MGKHRQLIESEAIIVRHLISFDLSYLDISRQTGIPCGAISQHCHEQGIARIVHPNVVAANRRTAIKKSEEARIRNTCICKQCSREYIFDRYDAPLRLLFCSKECSRAYAKEHLRCSNAVRRCRVYFPICKVCGNRFTSQRNDKKYCSRECKLEVGRRLAKRSFISTKETNQFVLKFCKGCGDPFVTNYYAMRKEFCSEECGKKYSKRLSRRRRKTRKRDAFVEDVDLRLLYLRDGGRCQLCGERLDMKDEVPHPLAPTIDHFIPLSKGGRHEYANVQLVCFACNALKRDRIIVSGEHLQMLEEIL